MDKCEKKLWAIYSGIFLLLKYPFNLFPTHLLNTNGMKLVMIPTKTK